MDYRGHITDLAETVGAEIYECGVCPPDKAGADTLARMCHVPPINGEASYVIALHELGHIATHVPVTPADILGIDLSHGAPSLDVVIGAIERAMREMQSEKAPPWRIERERRAWQWARDNALDWSPTMEHIKTIALASYTGEHYVTLYWRCGCRL